MTTSPSLDQALADALRRNEALAHRNESLSRENVRLAAELARLGESERHFRTIVSTDIADRKKVEEELRAAEERFALAVAGSNDGIWEWDIETNRMFMSERAQALFGVEIGPTIRPRAEWRSAIPLHPDDVESQIDMVDAYLLGDGQSYEGEWRIRQPDGSYRWVRILGLCVRNASGRGTRLAGSVSDIDARKRAEGALRQSQRMEAIGTLAGGIAHDFNNILGVILGFGEMLAQKTKRNPGATRDLSYIMAAGERGRSLVERILAFSGAACVEKSPVNVERICQETMALLSSTLPGSVRVAEHFDAGSASTLGDATQVHQVVMNLVTNAIHAMPAGGVLTVGCDLHQLHGEHDVATGTLPAGRYIQLKVGDSGTGIPAHIVSRIFDPFFTTKEQGVGTGLGLSLVHGIVREMGGGVEVETTHGKGSTFTVWLPDVGVEATRLPEVRTALPRGQQQRILVVDDEPALVHLATGTLATLGYRPLGFSSSLEAVARFEATPTEFDAVLTDERMPLMAGADVIAAVRALRPDIPIVLVTGDPSGPGVRRAMDAGANAIVGKPVAARDLARAMADALAAQARPDGPA
ncbi:hybrid sensor histidine kinase/response regulator [Piscinibacter gummiphilus]|uniref:histidine kinase n=1 Tax=Piscinibacter gummiphilus TaxID=946333 RepID=A0A1W6L4W6_9BURK|nr:ATP-binding protein [Piscinibacter gummiphilus]ARN19371.1 hypothetical protein A4W93_05285 [Piscinibacter gummiphilus]ATU64038.1 hypothetical protein CPZ87_05370 [Piscinibacter gummiphilus]GLS92999.1 hypothetical protein GCM10007918_02900 [Piscinibacter gummiphilus]